MTRGFGEKEIAAGDVQSMEISEVQGKDLTELPDDSGDMKYKAELPDDSGDLPRQTELPDDSGEIKEASIHKQDEIIREIQGYKKLLADTQEKGNFGEIKADQTMRELGYDRISKEIVTDLKSSTHQGIDGVYYNLEGHPPYIIADAKYNTAQLEQTQDGKQMSESWIDSRLDAAVGKERADEIREAMLDDQVGYYVIRVGNADNVNAPVIFEKLDGEANTIFKGDGLNVERLQ